MKSTATTTRLVLGSACPVQVLRYGVNPTRVVEWIEASVGIAGPAIPEISRTQQESCDNTVIADDGLLSLARFLQ